MIFLPQIRTVSKTENVRWEYDVVYRMCYTYLEDFDKTIENLKRRVESKCKDGWIPEGSFSIVDFKNDKYICQTIIRPIIEDTKEESNITLTDKRQTTQAYSNITMVNEF